MTNPLPDWRQWRAWRHLRPFQQHGRVLLLAGTIYVIIGAQYLTAHLTPDRRAVLEVALWFSGGSVHAWGYVWVIVGLLAVASARWPTFSKLWGYTALSGLAALWFFAYLTGVVLLDIPRGAGIAGSCAWGLITALWWFISGLVNPDDLPHLLTAPTHDPQAPPGRADPGG